MERKGIGHIFTKETTNRSILLHVKLLKGSKEWNVSRFAADQVFKLYKILVNLGRNITCRNLKALNTL